MSNWRTELKRLEDRVAALEGGPLPPKPFVPVPTIVLPDSIIDRKEENGMHFVRVSQPFPAELPTGVDRQHWLVTENGVPLVDQDMVPGGSVDYWIEVGSNRVRQVTNFKGTTASKNPLVLADVVIDNFEADVPSPTDLPEATVIDEQEDATERPAVG